MVAGKYHASFAHGDMVSRVEAASGNMAKGAHMPSLVARTQSIAAIFDDPEVMLAGYHHDCIQIERVAQCMCHHDGAGAFGYGRFDFFWVDVVGGDVHIHKHRHHTVLQHGIHGGWKTCCHGDDFIARLQGTDRKSTRLNSSHL